MSSVMKDLVSDRDSQRALGVMKTQTKRWSGQISEKGLLGFFARGFAADDIQECPGGFTIFMFKPVTAVDRSTDKKGRQQQIKSMFGSTELGDEAVKYYTENDFFIAGSLEGLEEQIYTCIKCLERFTERNGIATEGFEHGLRMLQWKKRVFYHLLSMDCLFPVKFAYLLDRVFQNFVDELGSFYEDENPIARAKGKLKNYQVSAINNAMMGFETRCAPRLFLPGSLQGEAAGGGPKKNDGKEKSKSEKKQKQEKEEESAEPWWSKNPSVVDGWKLPEGKAYGDFFNPTKPAIKANSVGWPKFPHHTDPSKERFLCIKYQVKGSCSAKCRLSHVIPTKMEGATKTAVDTRLRGIFA